MATERLSVGTNTTPSSDVTVEAGETLAVCIKGSATNDKPPNAAVDIYLSDGTNYWLVDTLTRSKPALAIVAPGTYRFQRRAGGVAVGVFSG